MRKRGSVWGRRRGIIHLQVDVPGLAATNGPLAIDNDDRHSADTTLAGFLDLIFDFLDVRVRSEVCDGLGCSEWVRRYTQGSEACWTYLILTHQARRVRYLTEDFDVRDILAVNDESVEEVRENRLLEGLATLFPGAVGEAVGPIGVYEDTAVTTTSE